MVSTIIGPVYGLKVPAGDDVVPATAYPASFRITMAAIDPTAQPKLDTGAGEVVQRATLKLIREKIDPDEDDDYDDDDDDIDAIKARLGAALSDEEDDASSEDDEKNGGPSDPSKSKKARESAFLNALIKEQEMDVDGLPNGVNGTSSKGKGKALETDEESEDDDEEEEEEEDDDDDETEEFVLCTLDPNKNYQQTLDITVDEDEEVYFKVTGTHSIFLTGNYIFRVPANDLDDDDSSEGDYDMDYDLSPNEDELDIESDEESDELDYLENPRVTEIDSDVEVPNLVPDKKSKNKRPAEESEEDAETLDAIIGKSLKAADATTNGQKLSKKQLKKLKKNDGQPVSTSEEQPAPKKEAKAANAPAKTDKKVQFAKNLEQGPSGSPKVEGKVETKKDGKPKEDTKPATGNAKIVNGVKINDKKVGKGRAAKSGDKLGMRYIGKLENGKVFDSNKKGAPFKFTLGKGEVIKGWDTGVAGMAVGGERRITVPPNMGYGSKKLPDIPANSTLVFDIKVLSIN